MFRVPTDRMKPVAGIITGTVLSVMASAYVQIDIYNLADALGFESFGLLKDARPKISFAWFYPITTFVTLITAVLIGLISPGNSRSSSSS